MATGAEWSKAYARQADADLRAFEALQDVPGVSECHKLQFLQMACEKLAKAHLCGEGTDPANLQSSHAYIAKTLPIILKQYATYIKYTGKKAREVLRHAKRICGEIEILAPAVRRGGGRPDNCEYPWCDAGGAVHIPAEWKFVPSQLLLLPSGRTFLKLLRGALDRLLKDH
ncbi:MAG: hypothetical protein L0Z62_21490 [Gemmataceae bacterium]|nr:hypothetical protein [Gemmataceae bacterium]